MLIQCSVDQKEAIKRGFNSNSTVKLDVDIATLTEPQRQRLADWFNDGEMKIHYTKAALPQPDLAGLIEFLEAEIEKFTREDLKKAQQKQEDDAKIAEYRAKFDDAPESCIELHPGHGREAKVMLKGEPYISDAGSYPGERVRFYLTPEQQAVFAQFEREMLDGYRARAAVENAEREAKDKAEASKAQANAKALLDQLEAHVAQVGGLLAERRKVGFASDAEIAGRIRSEARAAAGLTYTGGEAAWEREDSKVYTGSLNDKKFTALKEFKAKIPAPDPIVTLYAMWDEDENEFGDKVDDTKVRHIVVAEASWMVGEIKVTADTLLGGLRDFTRDGDED